MDGRKMSRHLRHHGKTRHRKGMTERRGKIQITHSIEERPLEAQNRSRLGIGKAIPSSEKRAEPASRLWSIGSPAFSVAGKPLPRLRPMCLP
nr:hypothetical protein [Mesosutterella multiformis]